MWRSYELVPGVSSRAYILGWIRRTVGVVVRARKEQGTTAYFTGWGRHHGCETTNAGVYSAGSKRP